MKPLVTLNAILLIAMSTACNKAGDAPVAEKNPTEFLEFGTTRVDNYYWLNNRKDPKVMGYLNDENKYFDQNFTKRTKKLNDKILKELKSRVNEDYSSVPYFENGYYYYVRYEGDQDFEIYCRKQNSLDSTEEVILDVNKLAENLDYCEVEDICVSPDNKYLAYGIDTVSRRRYEIRFFNMKEERDLSDAIPNTTGEIVFANDSRTTFYIQKETTTLRPFKLFRHVVGMDASQDKEIFYEDDPMYEMSVERSKDDEWIIINHNSTNTSEVRLIPTASPYRDPIVFRKRQKDHEYYVDHCNGKFYIRTNEKGHNYCIMTCDSTAYANNWKVLIPHDENVYIEDFEIFNNYMVLSEMRNGLVCFEVVDLSNNERHLIDLGQESYHAWISINPEAKSNVLRYGYSSFNTPKSIIDYDMKARTKTVMKEDSVPGYDKTKYEVKRLMVKARDGVEVPVSLLYRKDINLTGNNNMLIYGYGSYGLSEEDYYFQEIFSLIDRGFIFADAHIRGGSEMGRKWYEDGKLLKKMNTFNDFIDVSQYLIDNGYTSPDKLIARGGSAGGLLMGAVANMAPQLYKGIVADVPFVDVVTTMLDASIPLTAGEWEEWGNPVVEEYYHYMLSYSPYDNVKAQDYPAMLVTTGLHDSQVQYWEPAKWVAKLRDTKTDNNPLYLYTNMKGGHSGDSGRYSELKETAMVYTFILDLAGIKE